MQHALGQVNESVPARVGQEGASRNGDRPNIKEIPYDYVATFTLEGRRGNRVQDVINISVDGAFVAVAIGYSFIAADFSGQPNVNAPRTNNSVIEFKYSIIDSGSGRELQNKPIHNLAGLGESTGQRPFRPLAKPCLFMPRSTIRIEVEEISEGLAFGFDELNAAGGLVRRIGSQLYIVFHGYKMLGYGN